MRIGSRRRTPSKELTAKELAVRALTSKRIAERDAAAATHAAECDQAQKYMQQQVAELRAAIADATRQDAQRAAIAEKLAVAQSTAFELNDRIVQARIKVEDHLRSGRVLEASAAGTQVGSLSLTLQAAQRIIEELTESYQAGPQSDLSQTEIDQLSSLEAIAADREKSWQHVVPGLRPNYGESMKALGRRVAKQQIENPYFHNTPTPMQVR